MSGTSSIPSSFARWWLKWDPILRTTRERNSSSCPKLRKSKHVKKHEKNNKHVFSYHNVKYMPFTTPGPGRQSYLVSQLPKVELPPWILRLYVMYIPGTMPCMNTQNTHNHCKLKTSKDILQNDHQFMQVAYRASTSCCNEEGLDGKFNARSTRSEGHLASWRITWQVFTFKCWNSNEQIW